MQVITVPVKSLERAKTRLSPVLAPLERAALALAMMEDVLDACLSQPGWEVWVVSTDQAVLETSARWGARPVVEDGSTLLAAVRQVESLVRGRDRRLGVVLGDLPLLTTASLAAALASAAPVVASPAASDGGTNLLVRRPPRAIRARFGPSSFTKHRWAARREGLRFDVADVPDIAFDLDRPDDLETLVASGRSCRSRSVCVEMGLPARLRIRAEA